MQKKLIVLMTAFVLFLYPALTSAEFDYDSKKVFDVMRQLDMQGHADHDFSTCSMQQTYYVEVDEMFEEGMTSAEILGSYVDEYGQAALREPGTDGGGMIAWVMPVVAFILGVVIVGFVLRRFTQQRPVKEEKNKARKDISETEAEVLAKLFEEERRKHF